MLVKYVGQACPLRRPGSTLKLFVWYEINVGIYVDQRPDQDPVVGR
jgi:hypothetical protein